MDKINIILCKNCINCKKLKKKVNCKEGYFKDINITKIYTFTPQDFDCYNYES